LSIARGKLKLLKGRNKMSTKPAGRRNAVPTVEQITSDRITQLANEYWSPGDGKKPAFKPQIIDDIYRKEIKGSK